MHADLNLVRVHVVARRHPRQVEGLRRRDQRQSALRAGGAGAREHRRRAVRERMAGCGGGRRAGDRGGGAPRPIEASFVRESAARRCLPLPAPPAVLLLAWRSLRSRLLRPPSLRLPRPSLSTPGLYLSDSALSLIPPAPPPPSPSLCLSLSRLPLAARERNPFRSSLSLSLPPRLNPRSLTTP